MHQIGHVGKTESNSSNRLLIQAINPISKYKEKEPTVFIKLQLNVLIKKFFKKFSVFLLKIFLFLSNFFYNFMFIKLAMLIKLADFW